LTNISLINIENSEAANMSVYARKVNVSGKDKKQRLRPVVRASKPLAGK
jgi:hypothetical protein